MGRRREVGRSGPREKALGGRQCQLHNLLSQRHPRSKLRFCTLESPKDSLGFPVGSPVTRKPGPYTSACDGRPGRTLILRQALGLGPQLQGWLEGSGGAVEPGPRWVSSRPGKVCPTEVGAGRSRRSPAPPPWCSQLPTSLQQEGPLYARLTSSLTTSPQRIRVL